MHSSHACPSVRYSPAKDAELEFRLFDSDVFERFVQVQAA
jgi:hypothetical protein